MTASQNSENNSGRRVQLAELIEIIYIRDAKALEAHSWANLYEYEKRVGVRPTVLVPTHSPTKLFHEQLHVPSTRPKRGNKGKPSIIRERCRPTHDHRQRAGIICRCGLDNVLYVRAIVLHGLAWRFQLPDSTGEEPVACISNLSPSVGRRDSRLLTLRPRGDPWQEQSEVPWTGWSPCRIVCCGTSRQVSVLRKGSVRGRCRYRRFPRICHCRQ